MGCLILFCTLIASLQLQQEGWEGGKKGGATPAPQSLSGWGVTSILVTLAITFWPSQCARWWRMESFHHMAVSTVPPEHVSRGHTFRRATRARSLLIRDGDCCQRHNCTSPVHLQNGRLHYEEAMFWKQYFVLFLREPNWSHHLSSLLLLMLIK